MTDSEAIALARDCAVLYHQYLEQVTKDPAGASFYVTDTADSIRLIVFGGGSSIVPEPDAEHSVPRKSVAAPLLVRVDYD